jgi:putative hydrolase of HD superfamily
MPGSEMLQLLVHGNQLKRTVRSGWIQRGIADAEDVAAHSYGVAFTALVLAQTVPNSLNLEKVLIMALLHDLPEGLTTDIPTTAWRLFPRGIKTEVERGAMNEILGDLTFSAVFMAYWEELNQKETREALLVHDADKLDMYLQALIHERQRGNRQLAEFWKTPFDFFFPEAQQLFDELVSLRNRE